MSLQCPDSLAALAGFFQGLSLAKLDHLADIYTPGVIFRDPINEGHGIADLRRIYEDLFQQLHDIEIHVLDAHGDDTTGFLLWTMRYRFRSQARSLEGVSHVRLADDGRVGQQHDFWDASLAIYGEFPILGHLLRGIKGLVRTKHLAPPQSASSSLDLKRL